MTYSAAVLDGITSVRRLPGWSPKRAATCVLAATASVPAGAARRLNVPATSRAWLVNGSR